MRAVYQMRLLIGSVSVEHPQPRPRKAVTFFQVTNTEGQPWMLLKIWCYIYEMK